MKRQRTGINCVNDINARSNLCWYGLVACFATKVLSKLSLPRPYEASHALDSIHLLGRSERLLDLMRREKEINFGKGNRVGDLKPYAISLPVGKTHCLRYDPPNSAVPMRPNMNAHMAVKYTTFTICPSATWWCSEDGTLSIVTWQSTLKDIFIQLFNVG